MMAILNFGSCCIDNVYSVTHFVAPGETLACDRFEVHPGGKGLNQSMAAAAAGASVRHAGRIGHDGAWLKTLLEEKGVDTEHLVTGDGPTGHANIQVSASGENAIVLFGGANRTISAQDVDRVLASLGPGDYLLLQNEISELAYIVDRAASLGAKIVFNAAPFDASAASLPLEKLSLLIVNEIEGQALTAEQSPERIIAALLKRAPALRVLLTLGAAGAIYADSTTHFNQAAQPAEIVDTTGAGDTFTGYFLGRLSLGDSIEESLDMASKAAAICVSRAGAASSIPNLSEIT